MDACDVTSILGGPLAPSVCRTANHAVDTVTSTGGAVNDGANTVATAAGSVAATTRAGVHLLSDRSPYLLGGVLLLLVFFMVRGTARGAVRTGKKVAPAAGKVALAYTGAGSAAGAVAAHLPDSRYKGTARPAGSTAAAGSGVLIDNHSHADPWPAVIDKEMDQKGKLKSVTICASSPGEARQKVHGACQGHQFHEPIVKKCVDGGSRINYRFRVR
jgi:hypothetical protein